jgi:hypothetical protein
MQSLMGEVFREMAGALEGRGTGKKVRIGLTLGGSEHGNEVLVKGAEEAAKSLPDIEVVLIGSKTGSPLRHVDAGDCERDIHQKMEEMLEKKEIDAVVTMHYNFPIGVATVGRIITPGRGKKMYLATTTGSTATQRVQGMVYNAILGCAVAKAGGISDPTIGILNVEGSRQCERLLQSLAERGYRISFAQSMRADKGIVMRGNDLLTGTPDVMVTDTLTGNLLMKIFSAFTSGGDYETLGDGYGPGVGENFSRIICILSRASGSPVVAGAIGFAAEMAKGELAAKVKEELAAAKKAGLENLLAEGKEEKGEDEKVKLPAKKVVDEEISGVDIFALDNAIAILWKENIYAESGMGCTGPVVLVNQADVERAKNILKENNYL